ncbi:MAG: ZIP family metal transporter [Prevotellaceae bacterium]|nr:ZIP family metal transporter [Prevotellaceae bacterium]
MNGYLACLLLPVLGTTLGAATVFLMRGPMPSRLEKTLLGFASGVMVAAAVWSLLIPSMEMAGGEGPARVVPAVAGLLLGMAFLLLLDRLTPHQHLGPGAAEGPNVALSRPTKIALAVTLHNIPEGMAVGVGLAAALDPASPLPMAGATALALGIAIQNIPEGAIVSMPLRTAGCSRRRAFAVGTLSGLVEPAGAALTVALAAFVTPVLPYLLAFAAGAMLYVVVEELIPETQTGGHSDLGTVGFALGFVLMMALDAA